MISVFDVTAIPADLADPAPVRALAAQIFERDPASRIGALSTTAKAGKG